MYVCLTECGNAVALSMALRLTMSCGDDGERLVSRVPAVNASLPVVIRVL